MPIFDEKHMNTLLIILVLTIVLIGLSSIVQRSTLLSFLTNNLFMLSMVVTFSSAFLLILYLPKIIPKFLSSLRHVKLSLVLSCKKEIELLDVLNIDSIKLMEDKFLVFGFRSKIRAMAAIRLVGRPRIPTFEINRESRSSSFEYLNTFYKIRDFFSGLQRYGVPCVYLLSIFPITAESGIIASEKKKLQSEVSKINVNHSKLNPLEEELFRETKTEVQRLDLGEKTGFFKADILFLLWVDGNKAQIKEVFNSLENNVNCLLASFFAVFPEMKAERLEKVKLLGAISGFFCPTTQPLSLTS